MCKVIDWELCKKLKFYHTNKGYIHKTENEVHKILWDLEIQTEHPIQARKSDVVLINTK